MLRLVFCIFALFLSSCRIVGEEGVEMTVDSYLDEVPSQRTAFVRLKNKKMSTKDIEYLHFYKKFAKVMTEKGYVILPENDKSAAVILNLDFGAAKDGFIRSRYAYNLSKPEFPVGEEKGVLTSTNSITNQYDKFFEVTAVSAKDESKTYWKTTVVRKDEYPDFRSAEDYLLYLFASFIERDSTRRVTGNLSDVEFYQRYVLKLQPNEASEYFSALDEIKRVYLTRLQKKIDERAADFKRCGLTKTEEIMFFVSTFGTLPVFSGRKTVSFPWNQIPEKTKSCVVKTLEPLLEVPVKIDTYQPMTVKLTVD